MKVRDLKNKLSLLSETTASKNLDRISHWASKLRFAEGWYAAEDGDVPALKKLETLEIVSVKTVNGKLMAKLTKEGQDLYRDFMVLGYY